MITIITFLALAVFGGIVSFFTSAEFYRRFVYFKALIISCILNLLLFVLCNLIWFSTETDGFAQLFGLVIYSIIYGMLTIITGIVFFVLNRNRLKKEDKL